MTALQGFGAIRVGRIADPSAHKYIHIVYAYSEIDAENSRFSTLQYFHLVAKRMLNGRLMTRSTKDYWFENLITLIEVMAAQALTRLEEEGHENVV